MLLDPVPARFVRVTPLATGASTLSASVMVPTRSLTVTTTLRVLPAPLHSEHRNDVADNHSVISLAVAPALAQGLYDVTPKLAPPIVTDIDPVDGLLVDATLLTRGASIDHASVRVPTRPPDVITSRRVAPIPGVILQYKRVSDAHTVLSHDVAAQRSAALCCVAPKSDPCTVTLADPVVGRFDLRMALT